MSLLLVLLCYAAILFSGAFDTQERLKLFMARHGLTSASIVYGDRGATPHMLTIHSDPAKVYPYYSLSKPITAAMVMELADRHILSLDEPLVGTSPRNLMHHAGGWDRSVAGDPVTQRKTDERCVDIPPPPKQFEPGTRQAYSNIGYCILGSLIERRTGMPFDAAARRLIPATRDMRYDEWLGPAGGWSGTAMTYWRFAARPIDPHILEKPSYAGTNYYGLGWKVSRNGLSHFGLFRRNFAIVLKRGKHVVVALFDGNPGDGQRALEEARPILLSLPGSR
ncbi:hypothetical protein SCLO_1031120 [Sphingobium cloacae]|uniref:Beta-lactamase-related domain-containing protein n=1 Tax=Sphingobium cloacae TaxID=120107 RepID=A0A1E1F6K3_9SPHN|nr:hypothetical protein SCLO_1031120 [Sphingobium cloacae]